MRRDMGGYVAHRSAHRPSRSPIGPGRALVEAVIEKSVHRQVYPAQKTAVRRKRAGFAPMSLLTYEDASEYARQIRNRVTARVMPPWHINRTVGIREYKNDRGLTDVEIDTIVSWVDAGMPRGDAKDLPAPIKFPDAASWQLAKEFGPPDLVIKSPPYTLPALSGQWTT
jgi:hypothetical protein